MAHDGAVPHAPDLRRVCQYAKKDDNFTKRTRRAQGTKGHLPSRRAVATAQCPHAPVTLHCNTCGGCRDALPGHYLCCSEHEQLGDKANAAMRQPGRYHPRVHTHTQSRGVITPVGTGHLPKGCMRARGSHACRPIRGLLRPPATSVGAVGLCEPCSSRQGRAPLCPHKPTRTRKGQWAYKIFDKLKTTY